MTDKRLNASVFELEADERNQQTTRTNNRHKADRTNETNERPEQNERIERMNDPICPTIEQLERKNLIIHQSMRNRQL